MKISVFGNEIDDHDNTALKLLPQLKQAFPEIEFVLQDPTESIEPVGDPWIILDTAIGIDHPVMITSLDELEYIKGSSVHDFDVYMELRLQAKLKPLPALRLILVPQQGEIDHTFTHVQELVTTLL